MISAFPDDKKYCGSKLALWTVVIRPKLPARAGEQQAVMSSH